MQRARRGRQPQGSLLHHRQLNVSYHVDKADERAMCAGRRAHRSYPSHLAESGTVRQAGVQSWRQRRWRCARVCCIGCDSSSCIPQLPRCRMQTWVLRRHASRNSGPRLIPWMDTRWTRTAQVMGRQAGHRAVPTQRTPPGHGDVPRYTCSLCESRRRTGNVRSQR
jgi:hypothetical protein